MQFQETDFESAWLICPDRVEDERGFFARTWCEREFTTRGLNSQLVQCNISQNRLAGTLRGMHWQAMPQPETKLVRCTSGTIFDVIVDVRPDSESFGHWQGFELSAENRRALYIPAGFAHGFVTLEENSEVLYQMSDFYEPTLARGFHHQDTALCIQWPHEIRVVSRRDRSLPSLSAAVAECEERQAA